jgi:hypothetical protein
MLGNEYRGPGRQRWRENLHAFNHSLFGSSLANRLLLNLLNSFRIRGSGGKQNHQPPNGVKPLPDGQ